MAVAKSYENMEQVGQPFESNGKMYIRVKGKCPRCGGSGHYSYNPMDGTTCFQCRGSGVQVMDVRWYTDGQRASMDKAAEKRAAAKAEKNEERRIKFAARNAFGFGEEGFITIIWGEYDRIQEWRDTLPMYSVLYNNTFGWYIPAKNELKIPEDINSMRLDWNEVKDETDSENLAMKDHSIVTQYIHERIYGKSKSEYQGEKDEWLEHDVIIKRNIAVSSSYGDSHMHIMEDNDGNVYVWTTASKNLEEGKTIHLRMKVKDHKEYQGVKQTIVYYCRIK